LPSEAAMPRCAATVWLRVGKTLVTQAVRKPEAAMRGARPGADDHDVKAAFDDFVGFGNRFISSGRP
jgi:hypothetical protein